MHAYLLLGQKDLGKKISEITGPNTKPIPFELQKIDDVRNLQSHTKFRGSNKRYYVFREFQDASIEAMNAFLKLLEEPGENINFILCATNERGIPATILSRCNIIRLGHKKSKDSINSARKFLQLDLSEQLKTLHELSNRKDSLEFLSDIINGSHYILINESDKFKNLAEVIDCLITTKDDIEKNANITIAFSKLALSLVKLSERNYN